MTSFAFSCLVDNDAVLKAQAFIWVNCLKRIQKIDANRIFVHTAQESSQFQDWLRSEQVNVIEVESFDNRNVYCNKIQQLPTFFRTQYDQVVFMDCDTIWIGNEKLPLGWPVSARIVDYANPPGPMLAEIFRNAGFGSPQWWPVAFPQGPDRELTDVNNCNGGLYICDREFIARLAPHWRRWALWCLDNNQLFESWSLHADQVSFALAMRELETKVGQLSLEWNYPTHILPVTVLPNVTPQIIHYHREMTAHLKLRTVGIPSVDRCIFELNEHIAEFLRDNLLNEVFWDFRYSVDRELGSGIGSRGASLEIKRSLIGSALASSEDTTVVDVGCGDLEVTRHLPVKTYVGLDIAESALRIAREKRPDWTFQLMQPQAAVPEADVVLCIDVLIHQPDERRFLDLIDRLAVATRRKLIVTGYEAPPTFTSEITRYYRPITEAVQRTGLFSRVDVLGRYRDVVVVAAVKDKFGTNVQDANAIKLNTKTAKVVVGSGWWCDSSPHAWAFGSLATRSPAFFDLWYRQIQRCIQPERIVVTDSASPIRPDLGSYSRLQWIELDRNYGHANDIRTGRISTKYSGFTRSVISGAMYALCCDADYYVYVEQDCLVYGENFLTAALGESTADILLGSPPQNARGLNGLVAAPMLQQSLIIVRRPGLERFLIGLLGASASDGEVPPEEIMKARLTPFDFLRVPFGRSRPIDFDHSHFYVQHLDDEELARFLDKLGIARPEFLSVQSTKASVSTKSSKLPGSSSVRQNGAKPAEIGQKIADFSGSIYDRVGTAEHWDRVFAQPDPWGHSSEYEIVKRGHTLSALPPSGFQRALELACAEGHFTTLLAERVDTLLASDISRVALERAARRCKGQHNIIFEKFDLVHDPLPGQFDLIVCSEVLYYLGTIGRLRAVLQKVVEALVPGGLLVMTHPNLVSDDPDNTGFDWPEHRFGAKTIVEVASQIGGIQLEWELRTPLYRVQRFRRACTVKADGAPVALELPLSIPLEPRLERGVVWDGAIRTREGALRAETTYRLPILCYHRVAENGPEALAPYRVHPNAFEQQVRWLRRHGYYSVTLDQWHDALRRNSPLRGRPVLLTFDDGYRDFAEAAWQVLDRHGFSALVLVVANKVGQCADWDVTSGDPAPLMNWDQICELARNGVEFGSHSTNHVRLDALPSEQVLDECRLSRSILEEKLERAISAFCYPWGVHNEKVRRCLADTGYEIGLTTRPGFSLLTDDPLALPRIQVFGDCSLQMFANQLEAGLRMAVVGDHTYR